MGRDIREFTQRRRRRQRQRKKVIGLARFRQATETTTLQVHDAFCTSLCRRCTTTT